MGWGGLLGWGRFVWDVVHCGHQATALADLELFERRENGVRHLGAHESTPEVLALNILGWRLLQIQHSGPLGQSLARCLHYEAHLETGP